LSQDAEITVAGFIKSPTCFYGKWMPPTNTEMPAAIVALKYKELWRVERVFRDIKSLLETRSVYHQKMRRIFQTIGFTAFLPWSFEKNSISLWPIMGTDLSCPISSSTLKALKQVKQKKTVKALSSALKAKESTQKFFD
jgi:hypothetical protein